MNTESVQLVMFAGGCPVQAEEMYMIGNSECDFNQFKWYVSEGEWGGVGDGKALSQYDS